MILANTKITGYSLGLPLWWPNDTTQISTGWLQGISLTLLGAPREVFLSKYYRTQTQLDIVISDKQEMLCSLSTSIGTGAKSYPLAPESASFISGAITFFEMHDDTEKDLSGAQICPKYISFIEDPSNLAPKFVLGTICTDGKLYKETADLTQLTMESSANITVASGPNSVKLSKVLYPDLTPINRNDTAVYSINGVKSVNGVAVITFPADYVLSQVSDNCVKVGLNTQVPSCPDNDIISQRLNPGNYTQSCPLDMAFDTNNVFTLSNIVCTTYNSEYEPGDGLGWDEFSSLHDKLTE